MPLTAVAVRMSAPPNHVSAWISRAVHKLRNNEDVYKRQVCTVLIVALNNVLPPLLFWHTSYKVPPLECLAALLALSLIHICFVVYFSEDAALRLPPLPGGDFL